MSLDLYLSLVGRYVDEYDYSAVIQSYRVFSKKYSDRNETEMLRHIKEMLPPKDMLNIMAVLKRCGEVAEFDVGKAVKWLQQNNEVTRETLCGYYTSESGAKRIEDFLAHSIPVRNEFNQFCKRVETEPTPAMFANFQQMHRKRLIQTRYHPYSFEQCFWMGSLEQLEVLFANWYMEHAATIPSDIDGYLSVYECAGILEIKERKLLEWIQHHKESYICHKGRCLIAVSFANELQKQWESTFPVLSLLNKKLSKIPYKAKSGVKASVLFQLRQEKPFWIIAEGTLPQQVTGTLYTDKLLIASRAIDTIIHGLPIIPINQLKETTGMDLKTIHKKVDIGIINATKDEQGWYISRNECNRIKMIQEQYVALDEIVLACVDGFDTEFKLDAHFNRDALIDYCNEHDWWGLDYFCCDDMPMDGQICGIAISREDAQQLQKQLFLWLRGYRRSYTEKFRLVIETYKQWYPETTYKIIHYERTIHSADKALIEMIQLLFQSMPKEIGEMSDTEIEEILIERFNREASLVSCEILSDFLVYGSYTKRHFSFTRSWKQIDTSAYSVNDFAVMVWHIVNDEVIKDRNLIQKAICNKKYADLWLYIALHVYASWRSTDYIRMTEPLIPYPPEEMLKKIEKNELLPEEAKRIAEYFIAENSLRLNVPNKTKGVSGVPHLYFYCPQSCLNSFGVILAIAAAHFQLNPEAKTFVVPVKNWFVIKQFFGEDFLVACGNRSFSGRRANKALMQSIEYVGREQNELPPLVAYHLASVMRSHKLSYGKPSETTDVYLHDASFSGQTPEYVIYQMWERGVCSFVVDVMLKKCYGESYSCLTMSQQTEVITGMNLTPAKITNILRYVQIAEDHACEVVNTVCQSHEVTENALKRIALGYGTGKDPDGYCLRKAVGMDCEYKTRLSCMGCRYEIRTKALLLRYATAHQSLIRDKENMNEMEKRRCIHLCKSVTYPAMQEILLHLDTQTSKAEYRLYEKIIQEVMNYGITGGGES